MAASDVIALEHNFAQWVKTRGDGLTGINPFNYYAIENVLKDFPVNDKEIMAGAVDDKVDGGIDAFYFFANRKYIFEDSKLDPESEYRFNLIIFQCKEGSGFSPVEMGKLIHFADDLLDPHKVESQYQALYHAKLRALMHTFKEQYFQVAGSVSKFDVSFVYVSKLDVTLPKEGDDIVANEAKLKATISKHFPKADFSMQYINAEKLLSQAKLRKRREKSLTYSNSIVTPEGWITLVELQEFYKFLKDEHGEFHEQMLEENVRGFQKKTSVNEGIKKTLYEAHKSAEFWLPDAARARPGDYLNDDEKYKEVYLNEKVPLTVHVKSTEIVRRVESFILKPEYEERLLDLQFYVALIVAARAMKNAHIPPNMLASLNVAAITKKTFNKAFDDAFLAYNKHGADANASKSANMRKEVISMLEAELHG